MKQNSFSFSRLFSAYKFDERREKLNYSLVYQTSLGQCIAIYKYSCLAIFKINDTNDSIHNTNNTNKCLNNSRFPPK